MARHFFTKRLLHIDNLTSPLLIGRYDAPRAESPKAYSPGHPPWDWDILRGLRPVRAKASDYHYVVLAFALAGRISWHTFTQGECPGLRAFGLSARIFPRIVFQQNGLCTISFSAISPLWTLRLLIRSMLTSNQVMKQWSQETFLYLIMCGSIN